MSHRITLIHVLVKFRETLAKNTLYSEFVFSNRCSEEVSHRITIIHVLVCFHETLVKRTFYNEPVLNNRY